MKLTILHSITFLALTTICARGADVTTSVSDVRGLSENPGGKAMISYVVRHDVNAHVDPGTPLPGARVVSADHAAAFSGAYGDSVYAGAWLSPLGYQQFSPTSQFYENSYFFNVLQDLDAFGDQQGAAMEAGDHAELAMENITDDAAMTWSAARGSATGQLMWDEVHDARNVTATYGELRGDMDVIFLRADIVARGGDVDARGDAVSVQPLVVDLPKTYGPNTNAAYIVTTFFPAAQYVSSMRMQVQPQLGKLTLTASVKGYIPAANEYTTPSGAQIKQWHMPLNAVIMIKPTDGLAGISSIALPAGGRAVAGVGDQIKQLEIAAGGQILARTDGKIMLSPASDDSTSQPALRDASTNQDQLAIASAFNHSSTTPAKITSGDYEAIVDPDYRGEGVLAIRSLNRKFTGTSFADVIAVPFVMINGAPVKLDRNKLVDLRVYPDTRSVTIGFTGYGGTDYPTRTRTIWGSAFDPGLSVQAVYDLGNNRYAFVKFNGPDFDDLPAFVQLRATVVSLASGRRVASAPVTYFEIPASGPITYGEMEEASEFTLALDANSPNESLKLGRRSFTGTVFSASTSSDGFVTAVQAPGPLDTVPQPNMSVSLGGKRVALYYTQALDGAHSLSGTLIAIPQLDVDLAIPPAQLKPIDEECGAPQIDETAAPDAAPALDIKSAWFDSDDTNLYASIQVADLPATAPAGATYSWAMHWRVQHSSYYGRAVLDETGHFSFERGWYNLSPALPSYNKSADVTGDFRVGADGIVRIAIPRAAIGLNEGDILRDTSARSQITVDDEAADIDTAPNDADPATGTGGDYVVKKCGSNATATLLSVASRKTHGDGAVYDVDLTNGGSECRSGGANGNYTVVFRFLNALTSVGGVNMTGSGAIANARIGDDAHEYVVDLTGVLNAQSLSLSLTNVGDEAGNNSSSVSTTMSVLVGDTTQDRQVNSSDIAQAKSQSGAVVSAGNFREDVNADGNINSADIATVKSKSGTALP